MKIKELHLRNIASIKEADIDFSKDLVDGVTGNPASVFLICGDTGSGKSVILDGISMALYKTTPRISGVSNRNGNEFKDKSGETITVGSIEQYTRIGIGPKDECYSELVFEGNDGVVYRAKLSLGMMQGRDKSLKHRDAKWEVKAGTGDWCDKVKDNEKVIERAVGLTFEQFGRMAMLAQGQFASFLTGDKKEREAILEQLTNTEIFSTYGEAIKKITGDFKKACETAKNELETEKGHALSEADLQVLEAQKVEASKKNAELESQIKALEEIISNVQKLQEAKDKLGEEQKKILVLKERFEALSAHLKLKDESRTAYRAALSKLEAQIKELSERDALYTNAAAADLRIEGYVQLQGDIAKNESATKIATGKTEGLKGDLAKAHERTAQAEKAVQAKQSEIDTLGDERKALNPEKVSSDYEATVKRQSLLETLQRQINEECVESEKLEKLTSQIKTEEDLVAELLQAVTMAKAVYEDANEENTRAQNLLSTIKMGLDERIVELRKKLAAEHASICPLCGQSIENHSLEVDLTGALSPLEVQQQEAAKALKEATENKDAAVKQFTVAETALKSLKSSQESLAVEIARRKTEIETEARKLALDTAQPLAGQIAVAVEDVAQNIESLKKTQQRAEELQECVNKLHKEKAPLDKSLLGAQSAQKDAEAACSANAKEIADLAVARKDLDGKLNAAVDALGALLAQYYPKWQEDTAAVRVALKKDAQEYMDMKAQRDNHDREFGNLTTLIGNIAEQQKTICDAHPDWKASDERKAFQCESIHSAWTLLSGEVRSTDTLITSYRATISTCETFLSQRLAPEDTHELTVFVAEKSELQVQKDVFVATLGSIQEKLNADQGNKAKIAAAEDKFSKAQELSLKWEKLNGLFGGTRLRTLVQTYILRPLLNNANIYLKRITDRYELTCSEDNEQLSILVLDRYNKDQVRSVTVLSGGERFMISLALSLALSSLNRPDMNINILFIDEGFGTLDEKSLDSVMETLEKLQEIAGESQRRVGIISHREELESRIQTHIEVQKRSGHSAVVIKN